MVSPAIPRDQFETASWGQRRLVTAVEFYQRAREGRPSPCRFHPSCSSYAMESLEVHGAARGGWLTLRRLVRCRPFGPSGFDPVPPAPRGRATDIGVSHLVRHLRIAVPVAVQKG